MLDVQIVKKLMTDAINSGAYNVSLALDEDPEICLTPKKLFPKYTDSNGIGHGPSADFVYNYADYYAEVHLNYGDKPWSEEVSSIEEVIDWIKKFRETDVN